MAGILLSGTWRASPQVGLEARAARPGFDDSGWLTVPVPGHWQDVPELAQHSGALLYRRTFDLPAAPPPGAAARLRFDGTFYFLKVWLNGRFLGEHAGYFDPAYIDVAAALQVGENVLLCEVDCPPDRDLTRKRSITGVFGHWDCKDPKAEPGGLWRDVWLEWFPGGVAPEGLTVTALPVLSGEGTASRGTVEATLEYTAPGVGELYYTATLTPETFAGAALVVDGTAPLRRGRGQLSVRLQVEAPRLWWTWDTGRPDLYRLHLQFQAAGAEPVVIEQLIGFRSVELRRFICYLNGRRVFLKGNNYPPPDVRIARATAADYERDLDLLRAIGGNVMRVHAHVDRRELYEAASRLGILLWQDFPLQWSYHRSILPEAKRQIREMVRLLGSWPAVGIWCCHNEPLWLTDTKGRTWWQEIRFFASLLGWSWNKDVLDRALLREVRGADPHRPAIIHSGELGVLHGGATDAHHYWGWYVGTIDRIETVLRWLPKSARLVTEYGAQAFPDVVSSRRFVRGDWPDLNWDQLEARHMLQAALMDRYVPRADYNSFEEYVAATQAYQSLLLRRYTETLRRRKYRPCGGVLPFMWQDCSPGVSWAVLDDQRRPKAGYFALKEAFRPVHIVAEWPRRAFAPGRRLQVAVTAINDRPRPLPAQWTWRIERAGTTVATGGGGVNLPADGVLDLAVQWQVPADLAPGPARLVLGLAAAGEPPVENAYDLSLTAGRG